LDKIRVGVLAATGMVGQRYVTMLAGHPSFELVAVAGMESAGKLYGEAVRSKQQFPLPKEVSKMVVSDTRPGAFRADFVFSALPTDAASVVEPRFARSGYKVITDASPHRMDHDVPLLVPEVNPEHIVLLERQQRGRKWKGFIAATPNCTAAGLALVLKPIHDEFALRRVVVNTMQAVSGAGYPGVPSLDILDNAIPFIKDEEQKVETEPLKILGKLDGARVKPSDIRLSATCHRIGTTDGHMESIYMETKSKIDIERLGRVLRSFRGEPQRLRLHTAPKQPILVDERNDRPQVKLDRNAGTVPGMAVVAGRLRPGLDDFSARLTFVAHNTIRGAAGSTILAAELLRSKGMIG